MPKQPRLCIVGAGPTGLALANLLWQQGVQCDVIEKREAPSQLNKAIVMSPESLEHLAAIGCQQKILQDVQPVADLTMYWQHKRLCRIHYRRLNRKYKNFVHIRQPMLEKVLADHLHKQGGTILRGAALTGLKQYKDNVTVDLLHESQTTQQHYDYVIGCDGGQSAVRTLSHIPCVPHHYNTYFIVGDVTLDWGHPKRNQQHYFMSPAGYLFIVPGPLGQHRIVGSYHGTCDRRTPSLEELTALLHERGPGNISIKQVHWAASAPFYHQLAHKAYHHRIVLAGDAYHLFSPVGGINMNLGIQDATYVAEAFMRHDDAMIQSSLKAYGSFRHAQLLKLQKQTQIMTDLITQKSVHPIAQHFQAKMCNRQFMAKDLPNMMYGAGALPKRYLQA
jgi:2-polyprenyl-6-methoxyphenol hydroxylase-like FAD-dependent oxidoreductase